MSEHLATVEWTRKDAPFVDRRYSRAHEWRFDGGAVVPASSSPHVVRVPFSDPANVDPEEAFTAALSSCHMLFFLSFAAEEGFVVDRYLDHAKGRVASDANGRQWVAHVLLAPEVTFRGGKVPDEAAVAHLHHRSHEACFLASSVKTEISVAGSWSHAG